MSFFDELPPTPATCASPDSSGSERFCSPATLSSTRDSTPSQLPATPTPTSASSSDDQPKIKKEEEEKKPVKKRKSWGQQLPTPTTNLPPRKRAKTAEEKEQRRVERVLRNRAAAQKSREVKKQQLEKIEEERDALKTQNELLVARNKMLEQRLLELQRSAPTQATSLNTDDLFADYTLSDIALTTTLDPATLLTTPEFPSSDEDSNGSPCTTQQPAALLCDLPCLRGTLIRIFLTVSTLWSVTAALLRSGMTLTGTIPFLIPLTAILVWQALPSARITSLLGQVSRSTSPMTAPLGAVSLICSIVLARLRTATFYSSQRTRSALIGVSVAAGNKLRIGRDRDGEKRPGRRLFDTDRRSRHGFGFIGKQSTGTTINTGGWVISFAGANG